MNKRTNNFGLIAIVALAAMNVVFAVDFAASPYAGADDPAAVSITAPDTSDASPR